MDNKIKLIESDNNASMTEQELVEWKLWAEKCLTEDNTNSAMSSQDLKTK